jgi:hypothetical protein
MSINRLTYDEFIYQIKHDKALHLDIKKNAYKEACGVMYNSHILDHNGEAIKGAGDSQDDPNKIERELVINSLNLFDSHSDVHISKCFNKSIADNTKGFYLLESHKQSFQTIIAKGMQASTRRIKWANLGANYEGSTECLVFKGAIVKNDYNALLFDLYKQYQVDNHSVGMRYIKITVCVNNTDKYFIEEKANWDKYIDQVANKQDAVDCGYFYAVLEAKIIEGSAVLFGSNHITPILNTKSADNITDIVDTEPPTGTQNSTMSALKLFINVQKEKK